MNEFQEGKICLTRTPWTCPYCESKKTKKFCCVGMTISDFVTVSKFKCEECKREYAYLPYANMSEYETEKKEHPVREERYDKEDSKKEPVIGSHICEAIAIIKDWVKNL